MSLFLFDPLHALGQILTQSPGGGTSHVSLDTNWANGKLGKREIQKALRTHGIEVGILS